MRARPGGERAMNDRARSHRDTPLVETHVALNIEGEIVVRLESPTLRLVAFLSEREARDLYEKLQEVLQRAGGP